MIHSCMYANRAEVGSDNDVLISLVKFSENVCVCVRESNKALNGRIFPQCLRHTIAGMVLA